MSGPLSRGRAAVVAVLSAMVLVVLDAGMVSVAVPGIAQSFSATPEEAIRMVTVYQGAVVIGLLPCAHLAGRMGGQRLFLFAMVLFAAASLACAFAGSLFLLLGARALQGLGGAAIMALGISLLRGELGEDRVGDAIGWNALTVALCSAAAPVAGALVLSLAPWPWLFLVELPLAVVAIGAALMLSSQPIDDRETDTTGILLHSLFVLLLLFAVSLGTQSLMLAVSAAAGAVAVAVGLLRRHGPRSNRIWPTDLLALRPMRLAAVASVCCFIAQSTGILALSFQLQDGLGVRPSIAGLVMTCWPVTVAATSILANRAAKRTGSAVLCVIGGTILGAGLLLTAAPMGGGLWSLAAGAILSGLGFGLFQVPNNRTLFLSAPVNRSAAAGGVQGTARLLGQAGGALLIGGLFASMPDDIAPRLGFTLGSLFAFSAAMVSGFAMLRNGRNHAADRNTWIHSPGELEGRD